jgi:hypothetical protein
LANRPGARVLSIANTIALATSWGRRIRNFMLTEEFTRITDTRLADDSQAADAFSTKSLADPTQQGGMKLTGANAAVLGFRSDLTVLDDLVASGSDTSDAALAQLAQWLDTDVFTRFRPGGKLIVVQQRLNYNDPAGHLMRRYGDDPRVRIITLRMECEERDCDPVTGTDVLGRKPGDILWPEYFGKDPALLANAKRSETTWKTLYQQDPVLGTGEWCRRDQIQLYTRLPENCRFIMALDLASGSATGDYTAIVVCAIDRMRTLHVVELFRERCPPNVALDELVPAGVALRPAFVHCRQRLRHDVLRRRYARALAGQALSVAFGPVAFGRQGQEFRAQGAAAPSSTTSNWRCLLTAGWTSGLMDRLENFPVVSGPGA